MKVRNIILVREIKKVEKIIAVSQDKNLLGSRLRPGARLRS